MRREGGSLQPAGLGRYKCTSKATAQGAIRTEEGGRRLARHDRADAAQPSSLSHMFLCACVFAALQEALYGKEVIVADREMVESVSCVCARARARGEGG